jgi:hypothetical protein
MLKWIKRLLIGLAIVLSLLFAKAIYEDRQSEQIHQRALELLGHPETLGVAIDPDGTIRGNGYVIRP